MSDASEIHAHATLLRSKTPSRGDLDAAARLLEDFAILVAAKAFGDALGTPCLECWFLGEPCPHNVKSSSGLEEAKRYTVEPSIDFDVIINSCVNNINATVWCIRQLNNPIDPAGLKYVVRQLQTLQRKTDSIALPSCMLCGKFGAVWSRLTPIRSGPFCRLCFIDVESLHCDHPSAL